eukprot:977166-Pelagomonas_calceolata.AAC.1
MERQHTGDPYKVYIYLCHNPAYSRMYTGTREQIDRGALGWVPRKGARGYVAGAGAEMHELYLAARNDILRQTPTSGPLQKGLTVRAGTNRESHSCKLRRGKKELAAARNAGLHSDL